MHLFNSIFPEGTRGHRPAPRRRSIAVVQLYEQSDPHWSQLGIQWDHSVSIY